MHVTCQDVHALCLMASERQLSGIGDVSDADWICVPCGYVRLVWNTQEQHTIVAVYGTVERRMAI